MHRRSSVNFEKQDILSENYVGKIDKMPEFLLYLPENTQILHDNCPKNIFPIFRGGGGRASLPPPVSYAMVECVAHVSTQDSLAI